MLNEYERLLVAEIVLEFNKLNALHLQLFCDEIKDDQERYVIFKREASRTTDRVIDIAKMLTRKSEK